MKLIMIYFTSREEYDPAQETIPFYYSSKEEAAADFESIYRDITRSYPYFRFAGHEFDPSDFSDEYDNNIGVWLYTRPPEFYTIEEWFGENNPKPKRNKEFDISEQDGKEFLND